MSKFPGYSVVFESPDIGFLHLVKLHLESEDIQVEARDEHLLTQVHFGASIWATPRLEVPDAQAELARALVATFLEGYQSRRESPTQAGADRVCPSCGEESPASFESCWNCDAEFGG